MALAESVSAGNGLCGPSAQYPDVRVYGQKCGRAGTDLPSAILNAADQFYLLKAARHQHVRIHIRPVTSRLITAGQVRSSSGKYGGGRGVVFDSDLTETGYTTFTSPPPATEARVVEEPVGFEGSAPIFRVEDMRRAVAFYVEKLGFENAPWGTDDFTSVTRGHAGIYICKAGQGRGGAWAWIGVDDARKLHEEYLARGVPIKLPPTNFEWALEIQVEDPDGNVLRLGSEPE